MDGLDRRGDRGGPIGCPNDATDAWSDQNAFPKVFVARADRSPKIGDDIGRGAARGG